jgi:hypothetical protein
MRVEILLSSTLMPHLHSKTFEHATWLYEPTLLSFTGKGGLDKA